MSATSAAEISALSATHGANHGVALGAAGSTQAQYLTFMLGTEMFAVGILAVKEIIEYDRLTTVPMMPRHVRGVINLRGAVVPVLDLAARFGRPASEIGRRTCIVITEIMLAGEAQVVGLLVDAVNEVLDIAHADVQPAPSFGTQVRGEFIAGMVKMQQGFVILLAVEHLFQEEIAALAGAA